MLRWNKIITLAGYDYKLTLPNVAFTARSASSRTCTRRRRVLIDDATWKKRKGTGCLPRRTATSSPA